MSADRAAEFVEAAVRYSGLGWALVRCAGKKPEGTGWQLASPETPELTAQKWSKWGERFNIGGVCGPSGVAVIDVDRDDDPDAACLGLLGEDDWPQTPICRTGRGRLQVFYADPGGLEKRVREGFELRVGAHQCVLPPSVHPDTGKAYEWLPDRAPWEVELAELPQRVIDYFAASTNGKTPAAPIGEIIPIGKIDVSLTSLAGSMRRRGADEETIYVALVEMLKRCEPGHKHTEKDCRRIAKSIGKKEPAAEQSAQAPNETPAVTSAIEWQRLSEVVMRSIVFRDKPLFQAAAFHLLAGRKGMGKGTLLSLVGAQVTRGELGERRNVVWIGSEDSAAIDLKPRLVAAGADTDRVMVVKRGWIQLPRDADRISAEMDEMGDVGMLVIDPVGNHITGKDSNSETDIRDAIGPLNQIADDHDCMVFGVRHLSEKECSKGVLAAILGSSAWVQVPRAVLAVVRDPVDPSVSHIQVVAGNRLPPGTPGRMFQIAGVTLPDLENEVTRATWIGDSAKDVESMLGANPGKEPSRSATARTLILDLLDTVASIESDTLDARVADETGLSAKTIQNLRVKLRDEGLIRMWPTKDEQGEIEHWNVGRTLAPRPDPDGTKTHIPTPDEAGV